MNTVEFLPGIQAEGVFTFTKENGDSGIALQICKKETTMRTYKLAITYIGTYRQKPDSWRIQIDDQKPVFSAKRTLTYYGSRKFTFQPTGLSAIEIEETSEHETQKIWIDVSGKRYTVSLSPIEQDERIQTLVANAKFFKPADGKEVNKILFHNSVGVIVYARDERWNSAIYFANKHDDEFVKSESLMLMQCKCEQGDSQWEIKLPNETYVHDLWFAQGRESDSSHDVKTSWDGIDLQKVIL